jgi:hypothetical protein
MDGVMAWECRMFYRPALRPSSQEEEEEEVGSGSGSGSSSGSGFGWVVSSSWSQGIVGCAVLLTGFICAHSNNNNNNIVVVVILGVVCAHPLLRNTAPTHNSLKTLFNF